MGWTIPELNERMSAYELAQKEVLEYIDPWGPKRADYQAAVIAYVMATVFGGKRKPRFKKIMQMFDFADRHEQTDEDIARIFNQLARLGEGPSRSRAGKK